MSVVPPSPQQVDFYKFAALGMNLHQRVREMSGIIQYAGHNPTDPHEINAWVDQSVQGLEALAAQAKDHIYKVQAKLLNGEYGKPPLGYYPDGTPIYPLSPGMLATACILSCCACNAVIRGMGGPSSGAKCPSCFKEAK